MQNLATNAATDIRAIQGNQGRRGHQDDFSAVSALGAIGMVQPFWPRGSAAVLAIGWPTPSPVAEHPPDAADAAPVPSAFNASLAASSCLPASISASTAAREQTSPGALAPGSGTLSVDEFHCALNGLGFTLSVAEATAY